ncbi:MAG: low-specificity L-threonine aldolase, partial [Bacteroidota bacterium]
MLKVDLRSDTVTRPTEGMLKAMISSPVGDDVLGDDPTVSKLEHTMAARFGMESALFCVSGTQANQIALMSHLSPGDEVICHPYAHIYNYEGGGIAANAHASVRLTGDERGIMHPEGVRAAIQTDDPHFPKSRVLAVENTSNKGGGTCYEWDEIEALRVVADSEGLLFHLDGARLYNAIVAKGHDEADYGAAFDSISICLSKGLGAPV